MKTGLVLKTLPFPKFTQYIIENYCTLQHIHIPIQTVNLAVPLIMVSSVMVVLIAIVVIISVLLLVRVSEL